MTRNDCPLSPGARVWGYARDSGGGNQELSVSQQEQAFHDYCERFDLTLVEVFRDEARPGTTLAGRDAFDELMHTSRKVPRPVDGVLVWSFSRFARNQLDAQFFKSDLRRRGYELISLSDDLPDGDFAAVIEALIDWKNERFSRDMSRDVKRGLHNLIRQGYSRGGRVAMGYKAEPVVIGQRRDGRPHVVSRWVPDPETADLVRLAFRMRANGASMREIHEATHLYKCGSRHYGWLFRNEIYRGVLKFGDLRQEGAVEPLVDEETWEVVQEMNRVNSDKRQNRRTYLLSGLVACARCGGAMVGATNHAKCPWSWRYYRCTRQINYGKQACGASTISGRVLDHTVLNAVVERVLTADFVLALAQEASTILSQGSAGLDRRISTTQRQLADLERSVENLLDLAERLGAETAAARLLERQAEREELATQLQKLKQQRGTHTLQVDLQVVEAILTRMCETWANDELLVKRTLLKQFLERVEASPDLARLIYTFPISNSPPAGAGSAPAE